MLTICFFLFSSIYVKKQKMGKVDNIFDCFRRHIEQ